MRQPVAVLCASLLVAGCGGNQTSDGSAEPVTSEDYAVGTVRIVGSDPLAQVVLDAWGRGQIAVIGDLRDEVGGLTGAVVRVAGAYAANVQPRPAQAIEAVSYDILSVNGKHPYVGTLESDGGRLTLLGLRVDAGGEALAGYVGRRVWVVGSVADGALRVESYGVISGR